MLSSSKLEITQSSYIPGQEFPKEEKELEGIQFDYLKYLSINKPLFYNEVLSTLLNISYSLYNIYCFLNFS